MKDAEGASLQVKAGVGIAEIEEGLPIYIKLRRGKVASTKQVRQGVSFDKNERGSLLGVEIIKKVKAEVHEGGILIDCTK